MAKLGFSPSIPLNGAPVAFTFGISLQHGPHRFTNAPASLATTISFSGSVRWGFDQGSFTSTDLDIAGDEKLWGRGYIAQGTSHMWGEEVLEGCFATAGVPQGATSLTLEKVPTGWKVGNTVLIGSTKFSSFLGGDQWESQDEEVTLTDITGTTITWTGGLTHRHDNQLAVSTYIIRPFVALKEGRNISFRSEVTDESKLRQFGHLTIMHHHANWSMGYIQTIGLGRTDKQNASGFISGGNFTYVLDQDNLATEPATAASNTKGRYSIHCHHTVYGSW